jgi:hypothetical protein
MTERSRQRSDDARSRADLGPDAADEVPPPRGPLQGLQDLSQIISDHPIDTGTFLRGLTVGALVGAAIAGSAIWRRWRRGGRRSRG